VFSYFKRRRRRKLANQPFPADWLEMLADRVPFWNFLDPSEREKLQRHILVFLGEKHFEGCASFEITEEVRVLIAAQACLLILNQETDYYPRLTSILVYPSSYYVDEEETHPDGTISSSRETRSGESWDLGVIVLAWDEVLEGLEEGADGFNVTLHEFAHQLDGEYGLYEGAPELPDMGMYGRWAEVFSDEYERLLTDLRRRRRTFLDSYAAKNPAEFFAVASESFFERPLEMERELPAVYEQLRLYYRQDPAERQRHFKS
jgi:Mlc titration factor MtfA (ptsG expression regulator)